MLPTRETRAVGNPGLEADFTVERFNKRRRSLRDEYASYRSKHNEIAQHFRPRRGFYANDGESTGRGSQGRVDGYKRSQKIVNGTPLRVSKNAQSGLQAGVTSPSRPWKRLSPSVHGLDEVPGVKEFFAETDRRMDVILAKSNFYQATHTAYADFVDHGVGAVQIDEHAEDVIRCLVHPIGSWVAAANADGKIDVFYRDYNPTGHELTARFGIDALPGELADRVRRDPYKRYQLRNAIEPNPFFAGKGVAAIGLAGFRFVSVWWVSGYEREFIHVHGYHEFPVMVFRFYRADVGDVYGSGPGEDALGDAKQLQFMERKKLVAIDKMVDPPLQAPSSLQQKGVSLLPGKVTYHDGNPVQSLYQLNLPIQYVLEDIAKCEQRISETFFEDLFLMIATTVDRQVTAREIEERHQEKLLMLGPVLESISDELLDPAIDRVVGIMRRTGNLPEAPEELVGVDFKVEYTSILAQAQRAIQTVAIEQGVNFTAATAQFLPEALDRLNADGVLDAYFERIGMPPEAVRSVRDADARRAGRAQQEAQAQQMAMLSEAAKASRDAASAKLTEPNVLTSMLGIQPQAA